LVLWVLIGWQFTLAEYVGGIVMIILMTVLLRRFVSRRLEQQAREHAMAADSVVSTTRPGRRCASFESQPRHRGRARSLFTHP
jgi:hypothetical protein